MRSDTDCFAIRVADMQKKTPISDESLPTLERRIRDERGNKTGWRERRCRASAGNHKSKTKT